MFRLLVILFVTHVINFLSEKHHRTAIIQSYISWQELIFEVSQGCMLSLVLFYISLNDNDFAIYTDEDTIYKSCDNVDGVIIP